MQKSTNVSAQRYTNLHKFIVTLTLSLCVIVSSTGYSKTVQDSTTLLNTPAVSEEYTDSDALGPYGDEDDESVSEEVGDDFNIEMVAHQWPTEPPSQKMEQSPTSYSADFAATVSDDRDTELLRPGYGSTMQDDDA